MLYPPPFDGSVLVLFLLLVWNFYEKAKVDTSIIHNWELPRDKYLISTTISIYFFFCKKQQVFVSQIMKLRSSQSEICMLKTNKQFNPESISNSDIYDPCGPWMSNLSSEGTESVMSHAAGGPSCFHWLLQASQIAASGPLCHSVSLRLKSRESRKRIKWWDQSLLCQSC